MSYKFQPEDYKKQLKIIGFYIHPRILDFVYHNVVKVFVSMQWFLQELGTFPVRMCNFR